MRAPRPASGPHTAAPESGAGPAGGEPTAPARPVLLVVDDHPINQRVLRELVSRLGCDVDVVGSGAEAIAAFRGRAYDAVLMDCQMPGMDGYETTRALRAIERDASAARLAIIAVTACTAPGTRERCIEAGMDRYLPKPVSLRDLERALAPFVPGARALGRRPAGGEASPDGARIEVEIEIERLEQLHQLEALGPSGFLRELVEGFLGDLPSRVGAIEGALDSGDQEALSRLAHGLRGSAAALGAPGFSRLCAAVETWEGPLEGARPLVSRLRASATPLTEALRDALERLYAAPLVKAAGPR